MNRKIYRQIAKKHGVSLKEVKRDMQASIDEAYKNPNPFARSVPSKGDKPTAEFTDYLAQIIKAKIEP